MKGSRAFLPLLILFCFLQAHLAARETSDIVGDTFEETAGRGLIIRTNPSGVKVFINGIERGLTPITFDNFQVGEHQITLSREGYKERDFKITLFNSSRLVISIEMEEVRGLALVSVYKANGSPDHLPFEPRVTTNVLDETASAISLSRDNKAIISLPVGYHTIRARAFGWEETAVTVLIDEYVTFPADIFMSPAQFRLENGTQSRKRFNPMNSASLGVNEYRFEVSAPGTGTVTILNKNGTVVFSQRLDQLDTWAVNMTWNGRDSEGDPLPEGVYTVLIEASPLYEETPPGNTRLEMETEINYSLSIYPLTLMSGLPGLIFSPLPETLPARSYQLEAGVLFGRFHLPSKNPEKEEDKSPFTGFPFGIGVRASPFKNFEASAFFNINPRIDATGWGVTGSIKYQIPAGLPFNMAAGFSYSWASEFGENPISSGSGVGLYFPLSMKLPLPISGQSLVILSPAVFWRGPEGIAPVMLLSGGVLRQTRWINIGLSARAEFDFAESGNTRFLAGFDGRIFPPPSNFVISFQAGLWTQNSRVGGYGGISVGIVY